MKYSLEQGRGRYAQRQTTMRREKMVMTSRNRSATPHDCQDIQIYDPAKVAVTRELVKIEAKCVGLNIETKYPVWFLSSANPESR